MLQPGGRRVHVFSVTLRTGGGPSVTVRSGLLIGGSWARRTVSRYPGLGRLAPPHRWGGPIGSPSLVTATAFDPYGNPATTYSGTLHLATTDPNSTVSPDVAATNGVATFTVNSLTLGAQTLTVNELATPAIAVTESVTNTPGLGVKFVVTPLAAAVAGTAQSFQVTAFDNYGNVSTGYRGSSSITSPTPRWPGRAAIRLHRGRRRGTYFTVALRPPVRSRSRWRPDYTRPCVSVRPASPSTPRRVFAQLLGLPRTTAGVPSP